MVGLDAAGKTTILYKLKLGEGTHPRNAVMKRRIKRFPLTIVPSDPPTLYSRYDHSHDWI